MRKVVIGSDHAGYSLKERIKQVLDDEFEFIDVGTDSEEAADYPIYANLVGQQVAVSPDALGVVICGNGVGICIAANKVNGVRCGLAYSIETAKQARQHNNANVVSVGGRSSMMDDPVDIVRTFLTTDFSGEERHAKRVEEIMDIERNN
ncbi:RpiB/LacA/LacB family sugar-phosphate isomerase [Candidatus Peregrinibacteria bacterium]|nr:RpiB/LacA/LacB family sugar-phosphate isomerase [Candidatus Peregrinibacteria bacterium]